MILIYGADKNLMENIKLLDHNQPVVVLADNGRHGSHDKKKRRMKSCSRKLKHVLEKLDQRKVSFIYFIGIIKRYYEALILTKMTDIPEITENP